MRTILVPDQQHVPYMVKHDFPLPDEDADFTKSERALIRHHGHWLNALAISEIQPYNDIQRHFVSVSRGAALAERKFEGIWLRYMVCCAKRYASLPVRFPAERLKYPSRELETVLKIVRSEFGLYDAPSSIDSRSFEVHLRDGLGRIIPSNDGNHFVVRHRFLGTGPGTEESIVWIDTFRPSHSLVGRRFIENRSLAASIREILLRPIWHFIAEQGRRDSCIFCSVRLTHDTSRALGYGPICAKKRGLFHTYVGAADSCG